jgi:hypothetical protein
MSKLKLMVVKSAGDVACRMCDYNYIKMSDCVK